MLGIAPDSPASGARFVGTLLTFEDSLPLKDLAINVNVFQMMKNKVEQVENRLQK